MVSNMACKKTRFKIDMATCNLSVLIEIETENEEIDKKIENKNDQA